MSNDRIELIGENAGRCSVCGHHERVHDKIVGTILNGCHLCACGQFSSGNSDVAFLLAENKQFRAALSELEQGCRWNTIMHAGQPMYSTDECSVCGAQLDSRVTGKHREHCPFAVLEGGDKLRPKRPKPKPVVGIDMVGGTSRK